MELPEGFRGGEHPPGHLGIEGRTPPVGLLGGHPVDVHALLTRLVVGGQPVVRHINGLDPKEWPNLNPGVDVGPVDQAFLSHVRRIAPRFSRGDSGPLCGLSHGKVKPDIAERR